MSVINQLQQRVQQRLQSHSLYHQAQQRWQALNEREQRLLRVLSIVLGIALLYFVIWQPSVNAFQQANQRVTAQQQQLSWVQQTLARYQSAKDQAPQQTVNDESVSQRINAAARALELDIARLQPQQDSVLISIDDADFTQVLELIAQLESRFQLQVETADIAKLDNPGQVRVRQLLVTEAL
ncbi:MAG: type II secretion system protein GspM [Pseudomonadota bacterium]